MSELVERLRAVVADVMVYNPIRKTCREAADALERAERERDEALSAAAEWVESYAAAQRELPYPCAMACSDAATIIASQLRAMRRDSAPPASP